MPIGKCCKCKRVRGITKTRIGYLCPNCRFVRKYPEEYKYLRRTEQRAIGDAFNPEEWEDKEL